MFLMHSFSKCSIKNRNYATYVNEPQRKKAQLIKQYGINSILHFMYPGELFLFNGF
jgi:hypothetical protein